MTTPRIRVMSPELADQIAAGEVVERPASVVKELVENALDAGARRIEIDVEGGGLALIRVRDDGAGMTPEEAHLAIRRHATSKLERIEDLFSLRTMGFRGEALPSIAAVSELVLTTRAREAPELEGAYRLEVAAGLAGEGRHVGGPVGTEIEVRRLLANVPARLKFLKAEATESGHIVEQVLRLALAFPQVCFRLRSQGRPVIDLPPHASGLERARVALSRGSRTPVELHLAAGEGDAAHVEAYLASPAEATGTSRNTYAFVNGRFVRDRGLLQAIVMGYGELLERGRYPLAVVHVSVPPAEVDVNVHPQKLEVRFQRAQDVYATVRRALRDAIAKVPWLAEPPGAPLVAYSRPPLGRTVAQEPAVGYAERRAGVAEALRLFAPPPRLPGLDAAPPVPRVIAEEAPAEPEGFFARLRYLGQLERTYLVCEGPGELVLIDQHAAHERVAFQRLKDAHALKKVRAQRLLLPVTLELDEVRLAVLREHAALLASLGFELEPAAGATVAVRAVPEVAQQASPGELVTEILSELAESDTTTAVAARVDHLLATMACHSVVRAGDVLSEREVRALLLSMDGVDFRAHCPHGRPALLRLSVGELEKRFGRA